MVGFRGFERMDKPGAYGAAGGGALQRILGTLIHGTTV